MNITDAKIEGIKVFGDIKMCNGNGCTETTQYQKTNMSNDQWLYPRLPTVRLNNSVCCYTGCTKTTRAWLGIKKVETHETDLDRVPAPACMSSLKQDDTGSQT